MLLVLAIPLNIVVWMFGWVLVIDAVQFGGSVALAAIVMGYAIITTYWEMSELWQDMWGSSK